MNIYSFSIKKKKKQQHQFKMHCNNLQNLNNTLNYSNIGHF